MRTYQRNSPEAIARILAMFMITDGNMDERELDALEKLHTYDLIGLDRRRFTQILTDYCDDISDEADEADGTIRLIDKARVDTLLEDITDQGKRILTCAIAIDLSKSDGEISDPEIALLRYMMQKWHISLEDIEARFAKS
ncbi:hypothetical protein [Paludibacterium paludis]|uniref:Tellurite resistance protein TerB n=1 Tax=Paludibacterium paludis TaxID=1225769 RepID=A0A918P464_9NEIS|nr:hypothetical protein [Paludibacterium paludis]GGY20499.1 hypothetical protein GCM10011289_25090 [Paludibacterium paludis]